MATQLTTTRNVGATDGIVRVKSQLDVEALSFKDSEIALGVMPCRSIAASATRSSACIYWNLLVIVAPYLVGEVLHFRLEIAPWLNLSIQYKSI